MRFDYENGVTVHVHDCCIDWDQAKVVAIPSSTIGKGGCRRHLSMAVMHSQVLHLLKDEADINSEAHIMTFKENCLVALLEYCDT